MDTASFGEQIAQAEAEREGIALVHDTDLEWSVAEAAKKELDRCDWKINRLKTRLAGTHSVSSDSIDSDEFDLVCRFLAQIEQYGLQRRRVQESVFGSLPLRLRSW